MKDSKISQKEINSIAWKACDTFRGVVDPSEYKNYILVMLFVKYLSDVWKDRKETLLEKYNGDEHRVERVMRNERFQIPENSDFYYLFEHRKDTDIGEKINKALYAIEDANKDKLEGVFRNIDFNSESNLGQTKDRNSRLKHLLEDFADERMDLRPSNVGIEDIIGNTYEYLISRFASDAGKKGGEFYTPAEVSMLIAKLLSPKEGSRICDPTCGSGSLLIRVANEVGGRDFSLYGQESNGSTWALCKMNMFLHDMDSARVEWGDTIRNPKLLEGDKLMKFDYVVANPPFSLKKWGAEDVESDRYKRFWRGMPPTGKGDYAFISHMVETINETGKVGVVVPNGVLFRGSAEGMIREQFLKENLVEAVVGLPSNLFFGTSIPAAILVFNKAKTTDDVLFIDASREFADGNNQNKLREQDIEKVAKTYRDFETIEKYSYRATPDEIKENDYNLNIPRYVDAFEEEEPVDIKAVHNEIKDLEGNVEESRKKMTEYLNELGII